MRTLAALTTTAAAALLAAVPAYAGPETTWNLKLEAQGTYQGTFEDSDDLGSTSSSEDARWTLVSEIADVRIRDGRVVGRGGGHTTLAAAGGVDAVNTTVHGTTTVTCRGDSLTPGFYGEPSIETADARDSTGEVAELLAIRPFDELHVVVPCTAGGSDEEAIVPKRDASWPMGDGPWDALVALPKLALRQGTVIELLAPREWQVAGACGDWLTTCDFAWTGTLTLTQTRFLDDGDRIAPLITPPAPGPGPAPAPAAGPGPKPAAKPAATPTAGQAKLGPGASSASVQVRCAGACGGSVTATALGAKGATADGPRTRRPLATARFTLATAGARTVRLRFGAKARRAIRRAGGVRLTVKVTPRGGGRARTTSLVVRQRR